MKRPVFLSQEDAISYARGRVCFRAGEIRVMDSRSAVTRTMPLSEADRKLRYDDALGFGRLCTISCRRFSRKLFENTIELRERLKSCREGGFTNAQFGVPQEVTGSFEANAGDIIDKIYTGDLLEVFAQIVRVRVDCFADFLQRKLFG